MLKVTNVDKNGVGYELGIEPGDEIVSFDGYEAEDLLDYLYYEGQEAVVVGVKRGGKITDAKSKNTMTKRSGLTLKATISTSVFVITTAYFALWRSSPRTCAPRFT